METDFSYLATGNLDNALWTRLDGSATYHVLTDNGHALCRKNIVGTPQTATTEHIKRSTYGVICDPCRRKMAKVAATHAESAAESALEDMAPVGTPSEDLADMEPVGTPRMEITPRQVSTYVSEGKNGNGTSYTYSRTINGTPYSFTFVLMPNGERRHFVSKYNGYCQSAVYSGLMSLQSVLLYACAWSQVHSLTVPPPVKRTETLRNVPTSQLKVGDLVLCYGMIVHLNGQVKVWRDNGRNVYTWIGKVLNPKEATSECGIPRSFLRSHLWDGQRWSTDTYYPYWNVQGNDLARWTVEREV